MRTTVIYLLVPVALVSYSGYLYYRLAWLHLQSNKALQHVHDNLATHHHLLPHLLLALEDYARHERHVLVNVIHARRLALAARTLEERMVASAHLSDALRHLLALSERCHDLHHDHEVNLVHMKVALAEQKIILARDYYDHVVHHYNEEIEKFPHRIVARLAGFERKVPFYALSDMAMAA
jgi:LemA protein